MKISEAFNPRFLKAAFSKRPFEAGRITDTIDSALASAGLDTRGGPIKGLLETIRAALSPSGHAQREAAQGADESTVRAGRPAQPGDFVNAAFSNRSGKRAYKLYVPTCYGGKPIPLVVMLHGCQQSPDDFAAGTRMNALADERGFLVVYPAQSANANGSNCWNWFKVEDQTRDVGEPSLIAGITREVAARYSVDEHRIFIAGMSAGGAMAVILGETYPELYGAVGTHSGLPYGVAQDLPSAFAAMKSGAGNGAVSNRSGAPGIPPKGDIRPVPTIAFHGDRDETVNAQNSLDIVAHALGSRSDKDDLITIAQDGSARGRGYTRTVYLDADEHPVVEEWLLHGAGHAWSGGSTSGSFTDAIGPDASAEMLRFFLAQRGANAV